MRDASVHESGRSTRGSDVPDLPIALLVSPSGCMGATGTASISEVAIGEGHSGGTSGQPSSDDQMGEAGLLATDRYTHPVGHFGIKLIIGALLRSCCSH
jgi:hypothetical protein